MAKRRVAARKTAAKKAMAKKAPSESPAVACQCESQTNSWGYGLIIGAAFGALAGAITGNYMLWLPICIAMGLVFSNLLKC